MLKRIPVEQLRLGMYVHDFCDAYLDHPFWRDAFLLEKPKDLQAILTAGIKEVWIDTDKGRDVRVVTTTTIAATKIKKTATPDEKVEKKSAKADKKTDMKQEAVQALKICAKSKLAVTSMFHEARMGKALDAKDALPIVEEISSSVRRNADALISLARLKNKDDYTYMHSVAVCALMVALARQLGLDDTQTRQAGLAGLLHDVGKMMIPLEILNKPGKLTDAEFEAVKSHPAEGYKILLKGNGISNEALDVCLHHHEKIDGSGYPERLTADQISLYAKMGAVCDVYDAITSDRPYKKGWEPGESIGRMAEWSKGHFDKRIFQAFVKSIGIYPVGSLVRLESDRLAVIVGQTEKSLLTPLVSVFFSIKSNGRITPEEIDLSRPDCKDKIVSRETPEKWGIKDMHELWSGMPPTSW